MEGVPMVFHRRSKKFSYLGNRIMSDWTDSGEILRTINRGDSALNAKKENVHSSQTFSQLKDFLAEEKN